MDSAAISGGMAIARDNAPGAEKAHDLLTRAMQSLSASASVSNSAAMRLLSLEARAAELSKIAASPQPAANAPWRGSLPTERSSKILAAVPKIRVLAISGVDGNTSLLELCLLVCLAKLASARAIFEFGTFDGRTALNLAANCSPQGNVYTLDLPRERAGATLLPLDERDKVYIDKPASGLRFHGTPYEKSIVQLHGDSAAFDFSPFYGAMDFVFIDASHQYDYVLNDSRAALRLLRHGSGIVAWHDYTQWWDGVVKALDELRGTEPKFSGMRHIEGTALAYARVE